jgi:hypothetical protein
LPQLDGLLPVGVEVDVSKVGHVHLKPPAFQ